MKGFFQRILVIDLNNQTFQVDPLDEAIMRQYLGGKGLGEKGSLPAPIENPLHGPPPYLKSAGVKLGEDSAHHEEHRRGHLPGFQAPQELGEEPSLLLPFRGRLEVPTEGS